MTNRSWSTTDSKSAMARSRLKTGHRILAPINLSAYPWLVAAIDCGLAFASYCLAFWIRSVLPLPFTTEILPSERFFEVRHFWFVIVALQPVLMFVFDTYHE